MTARAAGLGLSAAVLIAAALDLFVAARGDLPEVSPDEMATAVEALRAAKKPGDVLVHSPLLPVRALAALGDLAIRPDVPRPEILASRRVLVLDRSDVPMSIPANAEDVAALTAHLELRTYVPSGNVEAPIYDLLTDLGPDVLHIERPVGRVKSRCTRPRAEGGFGCPGEPDWLYAARRTLRIGGSPSDCVWAHPTTGGAVVFTLPAQSPPVEGRDLVLELSAGLVDDAVRGTADGATVFIEARQSGRKIGRLVVPNTLGWRRLELSVEPGAPTVLSVTTPRDGRRHHCLNARILDRPRGEP